MFFPKTTSVLSLANVVIFFDNTKITEKKIGIIDMCYQRKKQELSKGFTETAIVFLNKSHRRYDKIRGE